MSRLIRTTMTFSLIVWALSGAGCAEDFEPFNLLSGLRVMAIKGEPPELLPGQSTEISALIYEPDGDDLEYRWSWCPIATGAATGYECAITEQDLKDVADDFFPGAQAFVPSFDLGNEETATFDHSIEPLLLEGLCNAILSSGAPSFVTLPDCEDELVVTVTLEVSAGGETVTAVKEIKLKMSDDAPINSNPSIGGVEAQAAGASQSIVLQQSGLTELEEKKDHSLFVEIPNGATETYVPSPTQETPDPEAITESLFMAWFVTNGSTEFKRTTYLPEKIGLDELGENSWKTPRLSETQDGEAYLFLVLQDERGGVTWTERAIEIVER